MRLMSSIKIRSKRLENGTEIRCLITHPMANGRKKDTAGNPIPAHHIENLWLEHNNTLIMRVDMAGSISRNPYFDFVLTSALKGDIVKISWADNLGQTDSQEHTLS
jgi:sulfur-oxidizing protein SoxZ